jgi:hypothetical protein
MESGYEDTYNTDYSNTDIIENVVLEDIELDNDSDELDDDFFVPELIFPGNDEIGEA